jgi:CheY-like chemotaxis protein/two-component sensor histidine kinase
MDHLRHLMDDLLDVSRIDRGLIELATEPLDLVEAVRQALQQCRTALNAGHREVSVALPAGPLVINADRQRAVQLVAGILDNAAKFTADNGRIDVVVSQHEGLARVVIRDDGVGIEADMLSEIFGMFSQANTDRHGLGVGLTVVRNLVELHGGTVVARSAGRGRGSEFQVDLPLAESVGSDGGRHLTQDAGDLPAQAPRRRRVLVVDDNRDAADSLTVLLAAMGEDTQTAYDGPSALLLLDEFQPEVVFLDLGMPEMDGFEVARRIRARHGPEEMTLVAVTGWGQVADRERVTAAGFDGHLVKPASYDDLRRVCQLRDRKSI